MKVRLVAHTKDPERLCAAAAKLCHEPDDHQFEDMMAKLNRETIERLLRFILRKEHLSILEHASFTFIISGVSRAMTHQLVRHRLASYSQQSQRYVRFDNIDFVIPPEIKKDDELSRRFRTVMEEAEDFYKEALGTGKIRAEDARFILPNATTTKIVVTMNARELRHFFTLRLDPTAQWEIRNVARKMLSEVLPVAPVIFSDIKESYLDENWDFRAVVKKNRN